MRRPYIPIPAPIQTLKLEVKRTMNTQNISDIKLFIQPQVLAGILGLNSAMFVTHATPNGTLTSRKQGMELEDTVYQWAFST